jgi:hypothetical protein
MRYKLPMQNVKQPVEQYYYSESEWDRLGCGPLPAERDRDQPKSAGTTNGNFPVDQGSIKP